ncbi:MAG: hypothetical protein GC151_09280 [Betaproteobacteria bacterium]|nr:hypothetical protein [Betaproteobacteria bacterium]
MTHYNGRAAAVRVVAFTLGVLALAAHAQDNRPPAAAPTTTAADISKKLDPTDFKTRFEARFEHWSTQDGSGKEVLVPRFEYAYTRTAAFRIDVPFQRINPRVPGESAQSGIGDVAVRGKWRVFRNESLALVLGSEFFLNTASDRSLGSGKYLVAPMAFAALNLPGTDTSLFPMVQHYQSVAGDSDRSNVSYTQFRLYVLTRWPHRFYTLVENQLTVDYERNSRVGFTIETELGHFLNKSLGVWVRPGIGLVGDQLPYIYNWNFEVGFRHFL